MIRPKPQSSATRLLFRGFVAPSDALYAIKPIRRFRESSLRRTRLFDANKYMRLVESEKWSCGEVQNGNQLDRPTAALRMLFCGRLLPVLSRLNPKSAYARQMT